MVTDQPVSRDGLPTFAHRVLDRLTAMKLRVGWLRLRLRLGTVTPEEVEAHLDHIEQEIDTAATLAHDVQVAGGSVSSA